MEAWVQLAENKGINLSEFIGATAAAWATAEKKDSPENYDGQWREITIVDLATYLDKHVQAIKRNGLHLPIEEGMEKAIDIINYGVFLYLRYQGIKE